MITEVQKIRPDEPWMEEGNNVTLQKGAVFIRLLGGTDYWMEVFCLLSWSKLPPEDLPDMVFTNLTLEGCLLRLDEAFALAIWEGFQNGADVQQTLATVSKETRTILLEKLDRKIVDHEGILKRNKGSWDTLCVQFLQYKDWRSLVERSA